MKFYLITITILIPFLSYSQIEKIDTVADTLQVNNKTSTKLTVKYWMDSHSTTRSCQITTNSYVIHKPH